MPRILVADDNTNIQKMVALAFHDRGIDVTAVSNGEAAVRRLPELNPDLILADIFMPVRNGYELCEWVKSDAKFSHIPVILLVGAFDPLDEKEARRVGADGVLKKPFIPPDPLIAMVTAALEKSSAVSAEPPKKEEPAVVPQVFAVPVKAPVVEAAPLPSFQDSSSDDPSLAYGFGNGRRTLEEDAVEAPEPRESGAGEDQEAAEDEFEAASTTKNWRRSAMEFEIPEGTSQTPAFSSEEGSPVENMGSVNLPIPKPAEEIEALPQQSAESELAQSFRAGAVDAGAESSPEAESPVELLHATALSAIRPMSLTSVDPSAPSTPLATVAPDLPWERAIQSETREAAAVEAQVDPEPSFASKAAHWMDLMGSEAEKPQGNWFSSIFGARKPSHNQEPSAEQSPARTLAVALEPASPTIPESSTIWNESEVHNPEQAKAPVIGTDAQALSETTVEAAIPQASSPADEPFFADEPESGSAVSAASPAVSAIAHSEVALSNEPGVTEEAVKEGEEHSQENTPAETAELISEVHEEPTLARDPALIEPPAVHVTPEPLLIDETPRGNSTYGARDQEIAPLYSFLSAAPKTPAQPEVTEDPLAQQAAAQPPPATEDEAGPLQFSASEFDRASAAERAAHRDALSEIAYLNPPPSFHRSEFDRDSNGDGSPSPATVDAIVQKVLEKIEPQIRELLSQNVLKPLVENLLQSELEKKVR